MFSIKPRIISEAFLYIRIVFWLVAGTRSTCFYLYKYLVKISSFTPVYLLFLALSQYHHQPGNTNKVSTTLRRWNRSHLCLSNRSLEPHIPAHTDHVLSSTKRVTASRAIIRLAWFAPRSIPFRFCHQRPALERSHLQSCPSACQFRCSH